MAITLMPIMNVGGMQLFKISSNDSSEKILPKSKEIALRLIYIYISLTLFCGLTYKIFGMSFFDSLTHSMTTIATGGFSNYNESIGFFNSVSIEISAMIFIILGSLPFIAYIKFLSGNKRILFNDVQIRTFFKIIIYSIIILSIYLMISGSTELNLRSVFFNIISILTGTGYINAEFDTWGSFTLILFLGLMFIGGCAGSTTCGVKIFRIQILYQFVVIQLKKIIYPKGVFVLKYDQNPIDNKFISSIISFIYLYLVIFFVLTALLSLTGLDFITSISGAATSISNVGPGLGSIIGPNGDFSALPDISKWILTLGMILGRLELFAILVLFLPSFWRN
jgi:trk system potassium uptake protein TrkH